MTEVAEELKVWHNGYEWVVAPNKEVAKSYLNQLSGVDEEYLEGDGWFCYDNDDTELIDIIQEDGSTLSLTPKQWVEHEGNKVSYFGSYYY